MDTNKVQEALNAKNHFAMVTMSLSDQGQYDKIVDPTADSDRSEFTPKVINNPAITSAIMNTSPTTNNLTIAHRFPPVSLCQEILPPTSCRPDL